MDIKEVIYRKKGKEFHVYTRSPQHTHTHTHTHIHTRTRSNTCNILWFYRHKGKKISGETSISLHATCKLKVYMYSHTLSSLLCSVFISVCVCVCVSKRMVTRYQVS